MVAADGGGRGGGSRGRRGGGRREGLCGCLREEENNKQETRILFLSFYESIRKRKFYPKSDRNSEHTNIIETDKDTRAS